MPTYILHLHKFWHIKPIRTGVMDHGKFPRGGAQSAWIWKSALNPKQKNRDLFFLVTWALQTLFDSTNFLFALPPSGVWKQVSAPSIGKWRSLLYSNMGVTIFFL